jgi:putative heme iron utilization protein
MTGIDCDGFDVRADGEALRFEFPIEVKDANEARAELVKLAQASRA